MEYHPTIQREYSFKRVEVFKSETLGTGSYGAVCKAKCDELICAAKLLYPVLFQMQPTNESKSGKEHRQPFRRFELECQFLSRINHPNIVQYLGTYHDFDSNSPVLLMELMDDSLTHFLESSSEPVPYHVQVNICYDIAQALAFLHSNGIIHRDLSSNNVLLLGSRAKVTDFGMSRFADIAASQLATMTTCPGTPAFMPPEALNEPPVYTEKIDNFSLGVLTVQILTREFPKPSDRYETRELVDPNFPDSKLEAKISVHEIARRHAHISLIDPNHPLLAIALNCLKDKETDRPSSQELCQSFGYQKETGSYNESSQRSKDQVIMDKEEQLGTLQQLLKDKEHELETRNQQILELQEKLAQSIQEHVSSPNPSKEVLAQQKLLDSRDDEIKKLRDTLDEATRELIRIEEYRQQASQTYQEAKNESVIKASQISELNRQLRSNDQTIVDCHRELTLSQVNSKHLLEQLGTKNIQIEELRSQLKSLSRSQSQEEASYLSTPGRHTYPGTASSTAASTPGTSPTTTPGRERRQNVPTLSKVPAPPGSLKAGSSTVCGHKAYFRNAGSQATYELDALEKRWSITPMHHLYGFTLVCVDGTLTSVGGFIDGESSGSIYSLIKKEWSADLPPMPIKRDRPSAVYTSSHLVVAGGFQKEPLKSVNVLDIQERRWYKANSLPYPVYQASMTVCSDDIYITAGEGHTDSRAYNVLKCSLDHLTQQMRHHSLIKHRFKKPTDVWQKITDLPVRESQLVSVHDQLFSVGGTDATGNYSNYIYRYGTSTERWEVDSEMSIPRTSCLVAVLMDSHIVVVGGNNAPTKAVDIITIS